MLKVFEQLICLLHQKSYIYSTLDMILLTLEAPTPQNGQTHSNNSSATADELLKSVLPFCGVGA